MEVRVSSPRHTFPFTAIVGQSTLKTALLLNAVDPRVGGVLIRGQKGTAKSTAVRALADLLPGIDVVSDCRFGCDPLDPRAWCDECRHRSESGETSTDSRRPRLVDLPISATEDRLVGTLDLEHALQYGERRFEPGLLADANRGILYVDEVNLLDDHLVDTLLDVAASGVNVVEREGVRMQHPSRFVLVGTMNPEEGELRPQLLDRFGLCVDVEGIADPAQRVEVIRRRRAFEDDSVVFTELWATSEDDLATRIAAAHDLAPGVELSDATTWFIARVCAKMAVDGHRADLTMARAAAAVAALDGRMLVTEADVRTVAPLVLAHRVRRTPFGTDQSAQPRLTDALGAAHDECAETERQQERTSETATDGESPATTGSPLTPVTAPEGAETDLAALNDELAITLDRVRRTFAGKRHDSLSSDRSGRYVRSEIPQGSDTSDVALDATLRAAAPFQNERQGDMAIQLEKSDVRTKVRHRRMGASILFCVDSSGSMGASNRIDAAKAAVLGLLVDAYQRRDRVGLVTFGGPSAQVVLSPTSSVELAQLKLRTLATGGATPLADGIMKSLDVLETESRRSADAFLWLVLVTDGRGNVGLGDGLGSEDALAAAAKIRDVAVHTLVIDTTPMGRTGSASRELARAAGGEYVRLQSVDGNTLSLLVRQRLRTS